MGDDNDYRMLPWQTVKCKPTVSNLPVSRPVCCTLLLSVVQWIDSVVYSLICQLID